MKWSFYRGLKSSQDRFSHLRPAARLKCHARMYSVFSVTRSIRKASGCDKKTIEVSRACALLRLCHGTLSPRGSAPIPTRLLPRREHDSSPSPSIVVDATRCRIRLEKLARHFWTKRKPEAYADLIPRPTNAALSTPSCCSHACPSTPS